MLLMNRYLQTRQKLITSLCLGLFSLFVSSCAIESVKSDKKGVFDKAEKVSVDSAVQDEFNDALVLLKNSEYEQAILLLDSVIKQEQRLAAPYINLGIAYGRINDLEKSEQSLIKAIEIDKSHPIANNELGLLYRKTGRFNEARQTYESILIEHSNYLPAIKNLGVLCEIYLHDLECALDQFEEYQKYYPEDKTLSIWVSDLKRRLEQQ